MALERTLSIVKPDGVKKNLIGAVYSRFTLLLQERMAPGRYRLVTGWYDETGARVPVEGGGDVIEVDGFDVQ